MIQEAVDHILVKYIQLVECILHNDNGIYKLALHIKLLESKIAELERYIDNFDSNINRSCDNCYYYKNTKGFCTNADANIPEKCFKKCPSNFYCNEHLLIND
jgi:hypothetical protein